MNLSEKDLQYIWHPCSQMKDYEELPPIIIQHAKGMYLYDTQGNSYMDVVSSWWCNLLGHCNNRINQAVKTQIDQLEHVIFANFSHTPAITLCEKLHKIVPTGLEKFFFSDNGSAAVEVAMKMSFQYHYQTGNPQNKRFITLTDAYHCETLGALSVGGVDLYSELYKPILLDVIRIEAPDCYRCKYGKTRNTCHAECFIETEKSFARFGNETSAFIIEPLVQAAAGMKIYSPVYLQKLRTLCNEYNVHLIADEIAVGYGRTGKMFACNHAGITHDLMCLSKGLTGGYMPTALTVTTQKIYDAFYADYQEGKAFMHSHTYCGNPLACAAAIEVLNILEEEPILQTANENSAYFTNLIKHELENFSYIGDIRSIGLINAIELVKDMERKTPFDASYRYGYQIYKKALQKGLLLRPLGDILYFNPPLIMTRDDMKKAIKICTSCIKEVL